MVGGTGRGGGKVCEEETHVCVILETQWRRGVNVPLRVSS